MFFLQNARFVVLCYIATRLLSSAHAQRSTARFLLWRPSATSNAMGGVGTALVHGAFSSYFNPAALAFTKTIGAAGSFTKPLPFFGDIGHSYFAASVRAGTLGTVSGSVNLFWKGVQVVTGENDPTPLGGIDESDWQAKLSFARPFNAKAAWGITANLLRMNLYDEETITFLRSPGASTSFAIDIGIFFQSLLPQATYAATGLKVDGVLAQITEAQTVSGISIGLVLLNLGPQISFIDAAQSDPLPSTLNVGFAYWPIGADALQMLLAVDFEKQFYESSFVDHVYWGGEVRVLRLFAGRAGYVLDTEGAKNSYFTWGGGLRFKFFSASVARYTRALLPSWHFDGTFAVEF